MLSRRDFLKKFALTAAGLYVAPKTLIFDMGAHSYFQGTELYRHEFKEVITPEMLNNAFEWLEPCPDDPFRRQGYFFTKIEIGNPSRHA